jgi:hypothetical protein
MRLLRSGEAVIGALEKRKELERKAEEPKSRYDWVAIYRDSFQDSYADNQLSNEDKTNLGRCGCQEVNVDLDVEDSLQGARYGTCEEARISLGFNHSSARAFFRIANIGD